MATISSKLDQGFNNIVYINGNHTYTGKKVLYHQRRFRHWDSWLEHLTVKLEPPFGAVRNLYTPRNGSRITEIKELDKDKAYVIAGTQKFCRLP